MYIRTSQTKPNDYYRMDGLASSPAYKVRKILTIQKNYTDVLFRFNQPIRLSEHSGLTFLILTDNPEDAQAFQYFMLSGTIELRPGIFFNTLAISQHSTILMETITSARPQASSLTKTIRTQCYNSLLAIDKVINVAFGMLADGQELTGVQRDCYELIYLDNGKLSYHTHDLSLQLEEGQAMIIGQEDDNSLLVSQGLTAYVSVFFTSSLIPKTILYQAHRLTNTLRGLIEKIIDLSKKLSQEPIAADYIEVYIKQILLSFLTDQESQAKEDPLQMSMRENYENDLFESITSFIDQHVEEKNEVQDLVDAFNLSRSSLQALFKKHTSMTPKQYINHIRLSRGKKMIRESTLTISQIADQLGFGSVQYFSRAFNKEFGLSPSAYAKSVIK